MIKSISLLLFSECFLLLPVVVCCLPSPAQHLMVKIALATIADAEITTMSSSPKHLALVIPNALVTTAADNRAHPKNNIGVRQEVLHHFFLLSKTKKMFSGYAGYAF